jgi:hypothetical protein
MSKRKNADEGHEKDFNESELHRPKKQKWKTFPRSSYEVGYAKPPIEHRFRPGQSGNPSGRPKGAKNKLSTELEKIQATFKKICGERVPIRKGNQVIRMPKMDYILHSAVDKAAKGHVGMTRLVISLGLDFERQQKRLHDQLLQEAIAYKNYHNDVLTYRKLNGIRGEPDPIPHPDDILIDRHGNVSFVGPITPEEKKRDDEIEAKRRVWIARTVELEAEIESRICKLKDRRVNRQRLLDEIGEMAEELDALKKLVKMTSRECRYGT